MYSYTGTKTTCGSGIEVFIQIGNGTGETDLRAPGAHGLVISSGIHVRDEFLFEKTGQLAATARFDCRSNRVCFRRTTNKDTIEQY